MSEPRRDLPQHIAFIIIGASGDLARRKVMPALFALYARGFLPENCLFFGCSANCFR